MSNPQKICVICGLDCSAITRYQAPDGSYYCQPCYEKLSQQSAMAPPPTALPPPSPSLRLGRAAPSATIASAPVASPVSRRPVRSRQAFSFRSPLAIGGAVLLVFVLFLILARFAPIMTLVYLGGIVLLDLGLGIAIVVSAFRKSLVQGLLTFFVPFYALYYVFGVSRSRLLMTLTALCMALGLGVFLLPFDNTGLEITSSSTSRQTLSASDGASARPTGSGPSDQDVRKQIVAGHSVSVSPRGYLSAYSKAPGGRQFAIKADGKTITFRSDKPLQVERWDVGEQHVMIMNDELFVNYRSYGALSPGVDVLVDHGSVFIGGKPATERSGAVRMSVSP